MFSNILQYYPINVLDARSIVMTSFFSHKTISHLDLQISHRCLYDRRRILVRFRRFTLLEKSFFCTEESLRNNLMPERRLLYTLNLDIPDGREHSNLRNGPDPFGLPPNNESLFVAVRFRDSFFIHALVRLIEQAFEKTDCKFKLVKWMADFRPLELVCIPVSVRHSCAMVLYNECLDSEFAMKLFRKFIHLSSFLCTGEIKVLEYLLYHARLCDFDVRSQKSCRLSLTDYCILYINFRFVHSFLKYEDTVYYTKEAYEEYKRIIYVQIRRGCWEEAMSRPEDQMNKLRLYRMLQIIHIFQRLENVKCNSEALRLVWSSISDCFVSLQEMKDAYEHVFPTEVISRAHSFYEEAIRQTVSCPEPRRLSQYCRSVVRKSLHNTKQWLPDGIKQLKLPLRFESFLNLERDNLHPENFEAP